MNIPGLGRGDYGKVRGSSIASFKRRAGSLREWNKEGGRDCAKRNGEKVPQLKEGKQNFWHIGIVWT